MESPNNHASETTGLRFQRRQITDATFIRSPTIIDHKNITRLGVSQGFQEDINASIMSDGQDSARDPIIGF
jgi:hypothetical protein